MKEKLLEVIKETMISDLIRMIISNSSDKETCKKVVVRPIQLREEVSYQFSEYRKDKVYHKNLLKEEAIQQVMEYVFGEEVKFRQLVIETCRKEYQILIGKKGTISIKQKANVAKEVVPTLNHNRTKKYVIEEGKAIPFLVDLEVMTIEGKVKRQRYDKFKQINRFLEYIEDIVPYLPQGRTITILDFGCGKSYLTFAMYYYLKEIRGYSVNVIGLDLKEDVIEHCNELSKKYGYEDGLKFLKGDIASYDKVDQVDMVVTLHACDTATDYAIYKAIKWGASVILSVPCCQHEMNKQLKNTPLDELFKYGLIKERTAALFTDAIRANLLEQWGYKTQILEFIDMSHTPKNILIRAMKTGNGVRKSPKKISMKADERLSYPALLEFLGVKPMLHTLLQELEEEMDAL